MKIGKALLDTNAIVHYLNEDLGLRQIIDGVPELYIPVVVAGELIYGAENSQKPDYNLQRLNDIMRKAAVLNCDLDTARYYSSIRTHCKGIGKPIPSNDIWIAAIALQFKLPLITRDQHFDFVPALEVVGW